jgi:ring-1,2-phenylacetyl-CoA epoxidase subunit PaaE
MSGLHFHPLRVRAVRPDAGDALIVSFDVPPDLSERFCFTPGQYLTLRHDIGGREERRSYSICAALDDGELRVGVRLVPGGVFSGWLHDTLKAGDALDVMPPQGRFTTPIDAAAKRHLLGIAGGSGITPILSIAKTVLERERLSRFTLVYGNRRSGSTMFKEELEDLKNRFVTRLAIYPVFSREQVDAPLNMGRLDRAKIGELLRTVIDARAIDAAFVCGPFGMNDEAEAALRDAGVAPEKIHIERFGIPPSAEEAALHRPKPGDARNARVTVVRDGLTREIEFLPDDPSILDAAARCGMDVPYSCKSGVCGTCRAKLVDGRVRMDRNFALEKGDLEAGFVLTCQSHPLTPQVTVSFDDR